MAYNKTIWKDRVVERIRTFTQKSNADGSITLTPFEGQVIEAGTPIIAKNLNNIEDKVYELDSKQTIISLTQPSGHIQGRVWVQTL